MSEITWGELKRLVEAAGIHDTDTLAKDSGMSRRPTTVAMDYDAGEDTTQIIFTLAVPGHYCCPANTHRDRGHS